MGSPAFTAPLALAVWFVVSIGVFAVFRAPVASVIALVGGQLLLPVHFRFEFAGLPDLDGMRLAALGALIGCVGFRSEVFHGRMTGFPVVLVLLLVPTAVVTALANQDLVHLPGRVLPALSLYDGLSLALEEVLWVAPFLVGWLVFRRRRDLGFLLLALVVSALLYSLLVIFELRMSPQLHRWLYGYHPHSFAQHIRGGGYRPMVFLGHGLAVSTFLFTCATCAAALWRLRSSRRRRFMGICALYLFGLLVLCKSYAPVVYALAAMPAVAFLRPALATRVAVAGALIGLAYPVLRATDLVPVDSFVGVAKVLSEERAESLGFRFENEKALLERALERPWFGWGSWNRNRVFDPITGRDLSVTDGYWIIAVGRFGIIGFAIRFAMLVLPIFIAARQVRRIRTLGGQVMLASLSLLIMVRSIDLLPNAAFDHVLLLSAGALAGVAVGMPAESARVRRASAGRQGRERRLE